MHKTKVEVLFYINILFLYNKISEERVDTIIFLFRIEQKRKGKKEFIGTVLLPLLVYIVGIIKLFSTAVSHTYALAK